VQHWDLLAMPAPEGRRDPIVLHSDDKTRSVLIVLQPGQSLGDHQVKETAWVICVEGSVTVSASGAEAHLRAGGLARFDPDERHALTSGDGARVLLVLAPWPGDGHYRGGDAAA
jgi:quercetin dioxygenase-like cupin family protein